MTVPSAGEPGTLRQAFKQIRVETPGRSMTDITNEVRNWLSEIAADAGLVTLFIQHTSASLTIQENADPDVQADLLDSLDKIAPALAGYRHDSEGPDDMPAHIKSMFTSTSLSVPVVGSRAVLGTWQGIYMVEHRTRPYRRSLVLQYTGTLLT